MAHVRTTDEGNHGQRTTESEALVRYGILDTKVACTDVNRLSAVGTLRRPLATRNVLMALTYRGELGQTLMRMLGLWHQGEPLYSGLCKGTIYFSFDTNVVAEE